MLWVERFVSLKVTIQQRARYGVPKMTVLVLLNRESTVLSLDLAAATVLLKRKEADNVS